MIFKTIQITIGITCQSNSIKFFVFFYFVGYFCSLDWIFLVNVEDLFIYLFFFLVCLKLLLKTFIKKHFFWREMKSYDKKRRKKSKKFLWYFYSMIFLLWRVVICVLGNMISLHQHFQLVILVFLLINLAHYLVRCFFINYFIF